MPAWVVSEANRYARMSGKTPFVIYQGAWNILSREFERETIPMARAHGEPRSASFVDSVLKVGLREGMALAPWNVFQQGKIRTDAEEEERRKNGKEGRLGWGSSWERTEDQKKVCKALEKVAAEVGATSIRAGKSCSLGYVLRRAHGRLASGARIPHAQNDSCLPYSWRA